MDQWMKIRRQMGHGEALPASAPAEAILTALIADADALVTLERRGLIARDERGDYRVTEAGRTALALVEELARGRT